MGRGISRIGLWPKDGNIAAIEAGVGMLDFKAKSYVMSMSEGGEVDEKISSKEDFPLYEEVSLEQIDYDNCIVLANAGDAEQMFICALYKQKVTKDKENAVKWYEEAVAAGNVKAVNNLACITIDEEGDADKVISLLTTAAEKGNAKAAYNLARCFHFGIGTNRNVEKAEKFYVIAANGGISEADCYLGIICIYEYDRTGAEEALLSAVEYFKKAAPNVCRAKLELATLYLYGMGVAKDEKEAFRLYIEGAEKDDVGCLIALAQMFEFGIGVEKNEERAYAYACLAAKSEDGLALFCLGMYYYRGVGTPQDIQKAIECLEKSVEQGCGDAMAILACFYMDGTGVEKDEKLAATYAESGAECGSATALYISGILDIKAARVSAKDTQAEKGYDKILRSAEAGYVIAFMTNPDMLEDMSEAQKKRFRKAYKRYKPLLESIWPKLLEQAKEKADAGNVNAQYEYASWLLQRGGEGEAGDAIKYLTAAYEGGHIDAGIALAEYILNNVTGQEDMERALEIAEDLIEDHEEAKSILIAIGERTKYKLVSEERVVELLDELGNSGDVSALEALAGRYISGGGVGKDDRKAYEYYCRAAKLGSEVGQIVLGNDMVAQGDFLSALVWYSKVVEQRKNYKGCSAFEMGRIIKYRTDIAAAECFYFGAQAGYKDAQFEYAKCLEKGEGVGKDIEEAKKWYKKAASQGLKSAEEALKRLEGN